MATEIGQLRSKVSVGMSTILVVENRCQFCFAFFNDLEKIREHSYRCEFRFAETFEASDGKVKFACAVRLTIITLGDEDNKFSFNLVFVRRFVLMCSTHGLITNGMSNCTSFQADFHVQIATKHF